MVLVRAPGFADKTDQVSVGSGAATLTVTLEVAGIVADVTVQGALTGTAATGKTNLPLRDQPLTVQSVPSYVFTEQATNDVASALQNVPGVYSFTNYGVYEGYTFRGFVDLFPSQANQLIDGVLQVGNRINPQTVNVDRIEVLKGPSSALYGGGAIGATVNIIRKKPSTRPISTTLPPPGNGGWCAVPLAPAGACPTAPATDSTSEPKARTATATTTPPGFSWRRRWPGASATPISSTSTTPSTAITSPATRVSRWTRAARSRTSPATAICERRSTSATSPTTTCSSRMPGS